MSNSRLPQGSPTEDTPTPEHDMFCSCNDCLKLKGGASDTHKGQPKQDDTQLQEAVKRFCRTEEAADNLVAYIKAQQLQLVSELERDLPDRFSGTIYGSEYETGRNDVLDDIKENLEHKKQELEGMK